MPQATLNNQVKGGEFNYTRFQLESYKRPQLWDICRTNGLKCLMKRKIIVVGAIALLVYPSFLKSAQANPITVSQCKDIPSCGVAGIVIGTEIVSGVLYYIVKNASGVVHKVRSGQQQMPAHRSSQGGEYKVNQVIRIDGYVKSQRQCEQEALEFGRKHGGVWEALEVEATGMSSPQGDGIPSEPLYICRIRKLK